MTEYYRIDDPTRAELVLIDLDTGTVLGNNVVAVPADFVTEETMSSDSDAWAIGRLYGSPLYV